MDRNGDAMKKIINFFKEHIIPVLIIFIFTLVCSKTICENDLFFDIKTGESILKYGFDFKDYFSWIPNLNYLYLHWLYDILIFYIYKFFNFNGLFILIYLIYFLFGIIFYKALYDCKKISFVQL